MTAEIDSVDNFTASAFRNECVPRGVPVLIRNANLMKNGSFWTLDYLASKHPHHTVEVEYYPEGNRDLISSFVEMDFAEYVRTVRDPEKRRHYYVAEKPLAQVFPNVVDELTVPPFIDPERILNLFTFAGIDTFTGAHYHVTPQESLLMQVGGRKEVTLYPPKDFRLLSPYKWASPRWNSSRLEFDLCDKREQNLEMLADLSSPSVVMVEPGASLFIPQGWFHHVRGIAESISVTAFFRGEWRNAHPPLAFRDGFARLAQRATTASVRAARRYGLIPSLVAAGVMMGVVPEAERELIVDRLQYLDEQTRKRPLAMEGSKKKR